jgi:hypothetical protein
MLLWFESQLLIIRGKNINSLILNILKVYVFNAMLFDVTLLVF